MPTASCSLFALLVGEVLTGSGQQGRESRSLSDLRLSYCGTADAGQIFRYWEHMIRDDRDFARHVDYIHCNPVKHGWVRRAGDWPHSSFHAYVRRGLYPAHWACDPDVTINDGEWRDWTRRCSYSWPPAAGSTKDSI
jgi:hypothetical protein